MLSTARFNENKVRVRKSPNDGKYVSIGSSRNTVPDDAYRSPDQSVGFHYGGSDVMRPEGWAGIINVQGPSKDMHLTAPQCRELADHLQQAAYQQEQWEADREREAAEARKQDGILVSQKDTGLVYEVRGFDPERFDAEAFRVLAYVGSTRGPDETWMGSGAWTRNYTFIAGARGPE